VKNNITISLNETAKGYGTNLFGSESRLAALSFEPCNEAILR
jgi:hypothetical protein